MATPIVPPAPRTDPAEMAAPAARAGPAEKAKSPDAANTAPHATDERRPATRLMIEDVGGVFVYTVLDRVSGQVIARIPRDSVEKLSEVDGYEAGAMIRTQA